MRARESSGWYATKYRSGHATYGSTLWARNPREAKAVARKRRMGETIESAPMRRPDFVRPSRLFYGNYKPLVVLHAASFLCSVAARAKVPAGVDATSDTGILHELVHYYLFGKDEPIRVGRGRRFYSHIGRRVIYDRLVALENATPGYVARRPR